MKLRVKMDCSYLNQKYKKGTTADVAKRVSDVLIMFGYAEELKEEKKTEKEAVPKKTTKKKSGDK